MHYDLHLDSDVSSIHQIGFAGQKRPSLSSKMSFGKDPANCSVDEYVTRGIETK